ncbi:aftiphilin-like [Centruroides sculpturatus]|uniref:aftiphilin-like n=1 Tax=Centruroides sculpturatus TaxID=218467 RepID=UPI000C6C9F92|nr:aftiphilin-like [Centruroides sculpturatus]
MSSNIIPMLPSTPPPLDTSIESDDDEFGNFTAALGEFSDNLNGVQQSDQLDKESKNEKISSDYFVQSQNDVNIQKTEIHINHFSNFSKVAVENEEEEIIPEIEGTLPGKTISLQNGKCERISAEISLNIQSSKIDKYNCKEYIPISDSKSLSNSPATIQESTYYSKQVESRSEIENLTDEETVPVVVTSLERLSPDFEINTEELATTVECKTENFLDSENIKKSEIESSLGKSEFVIKDFNDENEILKNRVEQSQSQNLSDLSKEQNTLSLPIVPKSSEEKSFQQKCDKENFEISPISISEKFVSASDASSEVSNFETAKSSPTTSSICDKHQTIENSENHKIDNSFDQEVNRDLIDEKFYDYESSPINKGDVLLQENSECIDDDFANFQQAEEESQISSHEREIEPLELNPPDSTEDSCPISDPIGDSDDFADFTQATAEENDFADFEGASWSQCQDDFADFEHASFVKDNTVKEEICESENFEADSSNLVTERAKNKITLLIHSTFPIIQIETKLDTDETSPFINEINHTSMLLKGRSRRITLLNLRNPSVPIYASSLGLLEPTKGPAQSPKQQLAERKHISSQESVPPVHFDWSDSGLVNPLDTTQIHNLFDLDFFVTQDNSLSSTTDNSTSKLEDELLGPSTVHSQNGDNTSPLIKQILASTKSTICPSLQKQCTRPPDLSDEVIRVLDKLPDLSFMQAKVLMFPVHNLSDH